MAKGYIDLFDRIDGGGPGQMGDTFKGGGILSMLANEFFTPYGSEDEDRKRRLMEARGLFDVLEAKTSKKSPFTPVGGDKIENKPVKRVSPQDMPYNNPQAIPGYNAPPRVAPEDMPYNNPQSIPGYNVPDLPNPNPGVGATDGNAELARLRLARQQAVGNRPSSVDMEARLSMGGATRMPQPGMQPPAGFAANAPSQAAMTPPANNQRLQMFNQAMQTVPQMLKGTQIEQRYRDYLLQGGQGTFAQFTGAQ